MAFGIYLDEDSSHRQLIALLQRHNIACLTASLAGMSGATDEQQLAFATAEGLSILSANRKDFMRIHTEWMTTGKSHHGILLVSRRDIPMSTIASRVSYLQSQFSTELLTNALLFISNTRVR